MPTTEMVLNTEQLVLNGTTQIRDQSISSSKIRPDFVLPLQNLGGANQLCTVNGFAMQAGIDMGGHEITGSVAPTTALSLVTKAYVDALIGGFTIHGVTVVADSNQPTLTGSINIDGIFTTNNMVVLLTAQTDPTQNGPWLAADGAWQRPAWWAQGSTVAEGNYFIADPDGVNYANTKWFAITAGTITVGTTALPLRQDLAGLRYVNGAGLTLNGVVFAVNPGSGITLTNGAVTAVGDASNLGQVTAAGIGVLAGMSNGQFMQTMNGKATWATLSGDATFAANGAIIVRRTGGVNFAPSATVDTTNAGNISSGTLPAACLVGSYTGITGVGTITQGTWQGAMITVPNGGTGLNTLPVNAVLLGNGTAPLASTAGTDGQLLIGSSTNPPAFQTVTGDLLITSGGVAKVDNTPGSGFLRYTDIIRNEVPSGDIDGTNANYTLANTPQPNTLDLYVNGVEQIEGTHYTRTGVNITMLYVLQPNNTLRADYIK